MATVQEGTAESLQPGDKLPTPVNAVILRKLLVKYADKDFVTEGFTQGFDLGYEGPQVSQRCNNSISVNSNIDVAYEKVMAEVKLGRIEGPVSSLPDFLKCSPLALREKSTPGKFRLLHDLSYPYNDTSVNANIPKYNSQLQYACLDDALDILVRFKEPYLGKSDIAEAYRILPLKPSCYNLTGFKLKGQYFFDKCLPMGASSSCKTFERVSSAIKYILHDTYKVRFVIKVLDDFLIIGETREECKYGLDCFRHLCGLIGVPIAEEKTEGPVRALKFLGIDIDCKNWTLSIPPDKISKYTDSVKQALEDGSCTLRGLKQIIGQLQFVTNVIPGGRGFLRRLHDATIGKKRPGRIIHLTPGARMDLEMWLDFMQSYNGKELISVREEKSSVELHFYSDSCPRGYGAVFGKYYLQGKFPEAWQRFDIQVLEFYPIVVMIKMFEDVLANKDVIFHTDNEALSHMINKQTSRNERVMGLLRPTILTFMRRKIRFKAEHIAGKKNVTCDNLSRMQGVAGVVGLPEDATPLHLPSRWRPHNLRFQ